MIFMAPIVWPTYIYLLSCVAIPGTSNQIQVQTPVINGSSHFPCGECDADVDWIGRTGGFVAILAIGGITLTVRACPQLCIVS